MEPPDTSPFVDLYWLPVGAGTRTPVQRWSLAAWEACDAALHRRPRKNLYHSALKMRLASGEVRTLELTPAFAFPDARPAMSGPVGFPGADRVRFLRYQMTCLATERLPDEAWTIASQRLAADEGLGERILAHASEVPRHTWGWRVRGTSEMWTSDSAISWLLLRAGFDARALAVPAGGRAPGWRAGLELAAKQGLVPA